MATFLLGVSSLHTGASIILLPPDITPPGNRAYQAIIPLRVQVEGFSIGREGAVRAKETLTLVQGCWATKFEATTPLVLAPVNHLETGKTGIGAIISKVKGTFGNSINPASGV